jgi:hypothetical protein
LQQKHSDDPLTHRLNHLGQIQGIRTLGAENLVQNMLARMNNISKLEA